MSKLKTEYEYSFDELKLLSSHKRKNNHSRIFVRHDSDLIKDHSYQTLPPLEFAIITSIESLFYQSLNESGEMLISEEFIDWGNELGIAHPTIIHDSKSANVFAFELNELMLSESAQIIYQNLKKGTKSLSVSIIDSEQTNEVLL